jgi:predicted dienelactone hydrolase
MTVTGAILSWDRAEDLRAALAAAVRDPALGPQFDLARLGVAGFSAGGFTALVASGARVEPARLDRFCRDHPEDGVCRPQREFAVTAADIAAARARPDVAADYAHAGDDHAIPGIRAAFVLAPALVQALDPASLERLALPVAILLGDADDVAPPDTNGIVAARLIPGAALERLPRVGHYDFLAACTEAGRAVVPQCQTLEPQDETHRRAIEAARAFFARTLAPRP